MSLARWRNPIIDLWVPAGTRHQRVYFAQGPEFGLGAQYHERSLNLDGFMTGPSDYDTSSDEVYCPCGATLPGWDGSAGELLRMIYRHCGAAGHPKPRFDR